MSKPLYDVEGFDQLTAKIRRLPNKYKKRKILQLMRVAARPVVSAAKSQAPVSQRENLVNRRYSRRDGSVLGSYTPGNLKRSMGVITGRRGSARYNPVIYAGPRTKGRKNDGYYGGMVHGGTVHQDANPFMRRAFNQAGQRATEKLQRSMTRSLQRIIDRS